MNWISYSKCLLTQYCVNWKQVCCYWHRPIKIDVTNLGHRGHVWRLGAIWKETKMEVGRKFGNYKETTSKKKKSRSSVYMIQHSKTLPGYIKKHPEVEEIKWVSDYHYSCDVCQCWVACRYPLSFISNSLGLHIKQIFHWQTLGLMVKHSSDRSTVVLETYSSNRVCVEVFYSTVSVRIGISWCVQYCVSKDRDLLVCTVLCQ